MCKFVNDQSETAFNDQNTSNIQHKEDLLENDKSKINKEQRLPLANQYETTKKNKQIGKDIVVIANP